MTNIKIMELTECKNKNSNFKTFGNLDNTLYFPFSERDFTES